jgi:ribosome-associated heat shock protein Hsp15
MSEVGADQASQRLDKWLWCARVMRQRTDCVRLIEAGRIRLNRRPIYKPHAKLRVGDVLTLGLPNSVRVLRVLNLGLRRGPAGEAYLLYEEIAETEPPAAIPCTPEQSPPYRAA